MCEVNQYAAATSLLRDYIVSNGPKLDFETANNLGVFAVAAIIAGGLLQSYPKCLKDIAFNPTSPDSEDLDVVLALAPAEDQEQNLGVNLFPYLGSAISIVLDNGTVLRQGNAPKSKDGVKPADRQTDDALFMAAAELQEAIDRGITCVTGWLAGLPGAFESTLGEDCVIEIKVNASYARLAEVLVDMSNAMEGQTAVI